MNAEHLALLQPRLCRRRYLRYVSEDVTATGDHIESSQDSTPVLDVVACPASIPDPGICSQHPPDALIGSRGHQREWPPIGFLDWRHGRGQAPLPRFAPPALLAPPASNRFRIRSHPRSQPRLTGWDYPHRVVDAACRTKEAIYDDKLRIVVVFAKDSRPAEFAGSVACPAGRMSGHAFVGIHDGSVIAGGGIPPAPHRCNSTRDEEREAFEF